MRRVGRWVRGALEFLLERPMAARGQLLPWAPVFLSFGIGIYFWLPSEPGGLLISLVGFLALSAVALAWRGPNLWQLPSLAVALTLGGLTVADVRAHMVAAPVLSFRYYGAVEGRVIDIDRSFSDQVRLTLDQVRLEDTAPGRTPARVRIALHGDQVGFQTEPGLRVMLTAHLSPPDGPVEPGGFDFQRLAWFSQLGGVGYTRSPVMVVADPAPGWALIAFQMRMSLSRAMQAKMEGQAGAFGAALMTGDRSGVTTATNDALRASNLSHIISISGLHMGLLCGFVFALCRYGLALIPPLALRLNAKKLAAVAALLAATYYMVLAGPDVATRRSYIMAAVILLAVLSDRRAMSLRSVAIAALICLLLEPESLIEPGFQMSFGATAALIVGFEHWTKVQSRLPALMRPVAMAVLSSLIAGTATAPIAAAHFNRIAEYGLLANLLAVPVMGIVVMPAGVMAAVLAPFGLAAPALWALEKGCALILYIADQVASLSGAVVTVPAPPAAVLPMLGSFGALFLIARQGWSRGLGFAGLVAAMLVWTMAERPVLLISGDGTLVGLMTPAGRAISKEKGGGFIAKNWLEDDGDDAAQPDAFLRAAFSGEKGALNADLKGQMLRVFAGKGAASRARDACRDGAIVVLSEDWPAESDGCMLFDRRKLFRTGAVAVYDTAEGRVFVTARDMAGDRLWNRRRSVRRGQ